MSADSSSKKSAGGIADILCEFFEIIIHNIIFVRKLYPQGIFVKRKKYDIVVYKSVHPYLNEYISQSLKAVLYHLKKNQLKKLYICFVHNESVIERYVFDVLNSEESFKSDIYAVKLEQHLRTLCLKLFTSTTYLEPLPENSNFALQLHISEYSNIEFNGNSENEDFPWIQVCANNPDLNCANIIPLHTTVVQTAAIQMYIESFITKN